MANIQDARLYSLVTTSLDAARTEIARRLLAAGLPLSITTRTKTVRSTSYGGWLVDQEDTQIGALYLDQVFFHIGDKSVPNEIIGMKDQLQTLAEYLSEKTNLAEHLGVPTPQTNKIDAVLRFCVIPLTLYYLKSLPNLAEGDSSMCERLASELEDLIRRDNIVRTTQLALGGIMPPSTFTHRSITLRPLSPRERGTFASHEVPGILVRPLPDSDLILPSLFVNLPSALIEITTKQEMNELSYPPTLPNRIVLAMFLCGFDVCGSSSAPSFYQPIWAAQGHTQIPLGIANSDSPLTERPISNEEFRKLVDLAYMMPAFSSEEGSGREVILYRILRGCSLRGRNSGLLDFAIALEAALLGKHTTELSYRFSLYGSLFLKDAFNPQTTFNELKRIYSVRSKLVHGDKVNPRELVPAAQDAQRLAKTLARKAIESGWPNMTDLNAAALGT